MRYLLASEYAIDGVFTMQAKDEPLKRHFYHIWANGKLQTVTARGPLTGEIVTEVIDLDKDPNIDLRSKLVDTELLYSLIN